MTPASELNMDECLNIIAAIEFAQPSSAELQKSLLEQRAKLGSLIDLLETSAPAPERLDELQIMADSLGAELSALCDYVCPR